MELLVPAGNRECLEMAVAYGADAVYLSGKQFGARKYADNFNNEEISSAVDYCHLFGVRVYVTVNTVVFDREFTELAEYVRFLSEIGVDAVIVQDIGVVSMIRKIAPKLPIHASTQMTIHDLPGVKAAESLGISRVVLARELSLGEIQYIREHTTMELEVFGHGALCMSYSGQCYMSSIIGGRSGNRGRCAQPCRLSYRLGNEEGQFLSLKDLCSLNVIEDMKRIGVTSLKIEGRMKGPAYVGTVTDVYRSCIDGKRPDATDFERLKSAFDRDGFTDGYLQGTLGRKMFSYRRPENPYHTLDMPMQKRTISITAACKIRLNQPLELSVTDGTNTVKKVSEFLVEGARNVPLDGDRVISQLQKTGETPFAFESIDLELDEGCSLPVREINAVRRAALEELSVLRVASYKRTPHTVDFSVSAENGKRSKEPLIFVSVETKEQAKAVAAVADKLFLPAELWSGKEDYGVESALVIPRFADEKKMSQLRKVAEGERAEVFVSDIGQVAYFDGLNVSGSFELNVTNSESLREFKRLGLNSCGLSYELSLRRISDMQKPIPVFVFAYGHMPLMLTKNCLLHSALNACVCSTDLIDRKGERFSVVKAEDCRNEIRNGTVLFNADRLEDFKEANIDALFLKMTSETPDECVDIINMYKGSNVTMPSRYTRGHLYKIVE